MNFVVVSKELWLFYTVSHHSLSLQSLEQVCAGFHPLEGLVCLNLELSIFITNVFFTRLGHKLQ